MGSKLHKFQGRDSPAACASFTRARHERRAESSAKHFRGHRLNERSFEELHLALVWRRLGKLVQDISQLVEPVAFLGRLGGRVRQGATPMMGEKGVLSFALVYP